MRVSIPISLGVALLGYACVSNTLPDFARGGPSVPADAGIIGEPLPASMKGYELYAWGVDDGLRFTLITGTNRAKTLEEVMVEGASTEEGDFVVISGQSLTELDDLLKRVPEGSPVVRGTLEGLPALGAGFNQQVERLLAAHAARSEAPDDAASGAADSDKLRACPALASRDTSSTRACTEIGCGDGFTLALLPRAAWPHGDYRFEITVDARSVRCEGRLPLAACGTPSITCDGTGVSIGESGCALDASQHAFSDLSFDGFPEQIHVEIFRDDSSLVARDLAPAYKGSQPNGDGCAPLCCNASAELSL